MEGQREIDREAPRVGLVGFGEIAEYHLRHLTGCGARVVGVVTSRPTPPAIERFMSLEDMLPHVDAITIAVPNYLHGTFCLDAVNRGKAVFVEKPLCISEEDLSLLEQPLLQTSAPVHLGYRLRWNPALRALQSRLDAPRRIQCTYRLGIERLARGKPWTRRVHESGGAFFTLGIHALDLARWLAGAHGEPLGNLHTSTDALGTTADFPLIASCGGVLPSGIAISATADLTGDTPFQLEVVVDGSRVDLSAEGPGPAPEAADAAEVEYEGLMADFVRAVRAHRIDRNEILEFLETHRELIVSNRRACA